MRNKLAGKEQRRKASLRVHFIFQFQNKLKKLRIQTGHYRGVDHVVTQ